MNVLIEALGLCAGTVICTSALPRILSIASDMNLAKSESISRNSMLCFGNIMWVTYGIIQHALAISVMCCIASILNGLVLAFTLSARRIR